MQTDKELATSRPMLFSGPMVRALLADTKTQTRRIIKPRRGVSVFDLADSGLCPYGQPGDRLWVKETIRRIEDLSGQDRWCGSEYVADGARTVADCWPWKNKVLPSIHCPRGLSRIMLEITHVRVERLNEISKVDAKAEGLTALSKDGTLIKYGIPDRDGLPGNDDLGWHWQEWDRDPRVAFRRLWEKINGSGSWDANPLVWVVSFKRVEK